jgi:UDP-glucose 4-epimerase
VYGPRLDVLDKGRVITIFIGQLLRGEPLTVVGDGAQTRCFTYVDDAIRATVAAGLRDGTNGEIFNIGTSSETTIRELAELMIEVSGSASTIRFTPQESVYGASYEDIPRRLPDLSRTRSVLGIAGEVPLREGLDRTIAWFRSQR